MSEEKSITIQLMEVLEAHGRELTELVVHAPRARDFEHMDAGGTGEIKRTNHLLASCAKIPYSSVLQLGSRDYQAALEALASLGFTASPTPSEESDEESPATGSGRSE